MTKDYAKRRRTKYSNFLRQNNQQQPAFMPAWGWMGMGLFLGICFCVILYWKLPHPLPINQPTIDIQQMPARTSSSEGQRKELKTKKQAKTPTTSPSTSARFDFYTVLPNMNKPTEMVETMPSASTLDLALQPLEKETPINGPDIALTDDELLTAKKALTVTQNPSYIIQAGSFHRQEQAETLKAQLALYGFEASIQTFKMGNRDTRYRVVIGPFVNKDQAYLQQKQLEQAQQLHSVVLKIRV